MPQTDRSPGHREVCRASVTGLIQPTLALSDQCQHVGMSAPELAVFTPHDQPGFADLVNEVHAEFGFAYHPRLDADLATPFAHYRHVWVLKLDDVVIGTVALTAPEDGTTTLKRMYLRTEFRGQGWGRHLLTTALEAAIRDRCTRIELDTSDRQAAACHLYESAGFTRHHQVGSARYYGKDLADTNA